jgi:16S rRNA (guanine527-N7)-methyltransferase
MTVRTLADRFSLDDTQAARISALAEIVAGNPLAPTTITAPDDVLRDHIADSLVALDLAAVRAAREVADLGAGAGFPGLPLAVALPEATMSLVESNARKCAFLLRAREVAGVVNASVVTARAEEWTAGIGRCDLVMARALAPLAVVAEYAAPLLRVGGSLIAWRGRRDSDDEAAAARAAAILGLDVAPPIRVLPYDGATDRHLHPLIKVSPTPPRFPRRAGMARKRPLG